MRLRANSTIAIATINGTDEAAAAAMLACLIAREVISVIQRCLDRTNSVFNVVDRTWVLVSIDSCHGRRASTARTRARIVDIHVTI